LPQIASSGQQASPRRKTAARRTLVGNVKLLFDENLSTTLPHELRAEYPESAHVLTLGLGGTSDRVVWERAAVDGFVLVTKDQDFQRLSVLRGAPPKVIWVRLGNCATADIVRLLHFRRDQITAFVESSGTDFLALG
jgi:predicted nuclease of predicted toxin-antitoxin system